MGIKIDTETYVQVCYYGKAATKHSPVILFLLFLVLFYFC